MITKKSIILSTKKEKPSKDVRDTIIISVKKIITSLGFTDFLLEWIPGVPVNKLLISIYCTDENVEILRDKLSSAPLLKKHSKLLPKTTTLNKLSLVRE
jgi:hypothetical protein